MRLQLLIVISVRISIYYMQAHRHRHHHLFLCWLMLAQIFLARAILVEGARKGPCRAGCDGEQQNRSSAGVQCHSRA